MLWNNVQKFAQSDRVPLLVIVICILWNFHLTARVSELSRSPRSAPPDLKGMVLNKIGGYDFNGRLIIHNFDETSQNVLLLFTSETCPHCVAQWPEWIQLLKSIKEAKTNVRVFAMTHEAIGSTRGGADAGGVHEWFNPDAKTALALNLVATPQTFLINKRGFVEVAIIGRDRFVERKILGALSSSE